MSKAKPLQYGKLRDTRAAIVFLTPNLIGFLFFTSLPLLASLALTCFDWDFISSPKASNWVL